MEKLSNLLARVCFMLFAWAWAQVDHKLRKAKAHLHKVQLNLMQNAKKAYCIWSLKWPGFCWVGKQWAKVFTGRLPCW